MLGHFRDGVLGLVVWWFATGLLNWLTFPRDAKEAERIQREEPKRWAIIQGFRAWGLYPAKALLVFDVLFRGKPWEEPGAKADGKPDDSPR